VCVKFYTIVKFLRKLFGHKFNRLLEEIFFDKTFLGTSILCFFAIFLCMVQVGRQNYMRMFFILFFHILLIVKFSYCYIFICMVQVGHQNYMRMFFFFSYFVNSQICLLPYSYAWSKLVTKII
jgi:hypothetical protein